MEKILTIVIPSFNTEQFIDKNVPSFLDSQILDEIELLLINDGSTDSTELKAKEYEKKYPKTVKVITKENGGHGSVINRGIMEAKGKYFKVVDGDDWVVTENLVCLIKRLQEIDCDMIINPYNIVYENNMEKLHEVKFNSPVVNKKVRFENIAKYYQKLPIHCITYRTDLLRDENLKVRENCYYEDNEFCFFPIPYVNSVLILDYPVYNYLMGQKGQSVSDKNALKNRDMFKQVVYDCINYYENNIMNISKASSKYMRNTLFEMIRSEYNIFLRNGFDGKVYLLFKSFNKEFRELYPYYYKETAKKYFHVWCVQTENKIIFFLESLLISIYRKIRIYC